MQDQDLLIAYLIMAHRDPKQVARLIEQLDSPSVAFFLHVDGKTDIKPFLKLERDRENTYVLRNRVDVFWCGYTQVKAILYLIRRAFEHQFEYGVLLSGQDYPIKPNEYIYDFLSHSDTEYIYFFRISDRPKWWARIKYYHYFDSYLTNPRLGVEVPGLKGLKFPGFVSLAYKKMLEGGALKAVLPERTFIPDLIPYGGSTWWMLSRDCLGYVLDQVEKRKELHDFFRFTYTPDELIFQTIILNSPFADKSVNFEAYQDWRRKGTPGDGVLDETTFHYRYLRSEENDEGFTKGITTLSEKHFEEIEDSEALFARKFDPSRSGKLLDMIDQRLLD